MKQALPPITMIAGQPVLFIMAAEPEYGPALRARIQPLMTGIGPVESAIATSAALTRLPRNPALVVSLGSAGSQVLEQCGVYQASHVSYRDMDASPLGFAKGTTPLLDLPAEIALPLRIPGIPTARLSTGGNIVSGAGYDGIDAEMVDMETFAILRCCQQAGVPLIGLRGISDGKAPLEGLRDWTQYLHIIDEKLAAAIDMLDTALTSGAMRL
ncbi:MAG: 5'-methylthioadenosine/S-adenosylhomocysteine nucleosidase [Paracoccus sp. (in: a-proteobacteria)]|uniref:5'-methylthioadenosine/S-adenosylhomocysteine nucleosidase n=1 Tax=Paracoccus sp. TaxID=267 RepID=UPI0026DFAF80|nr:5'-methylthioadenosine/S-adenosylhomocysteine nucleosidase [Paracoccus sp. (in: a-proteobacteria)]MDO5620489.1 5'-methylthioadenosine/S-adenosylhomocysteine nucleosidase [Paracoccus sp. (in: a-proteobacteria)]